MSTAPNALTPEEREELEQVRATRSSRLGELLIYVSNPDGTLDVNRLSFLNTIFESGNPKDKYLNDLPSNLDGDTTTPPSSVTDLEKVLTSPANRGYIESLHAQIPNSN